MWYGQVSEGACFMLIFFLLLENVDFSRHSAEAMTPSPGCLNARVIHIVRT